MSGTKHPNSDIDTFVVNKITASAGLDSVSCDSKESIVLDEKEVTWTYTFEKKGAGVTASLNISDPLYFCDVSFAKSEKNHFPLKSYLKYIVKSNEIELLFENFIDEEISAEEYTLNYLTIFNKYMKTAEVQKIMNGEFWPEVPLE